jgi:hypothetical protein
LKLSTDFQQIVVGISAAPRRRKKSYHLDCNESVDIPDLKKCTMYKEFPNEQMDLMPNLQIGGVQFDCFLTQSTRLTPWSLGLG